MSRRHIQNLESFRCVFLLFSFFKSFLSSYIFLFSSLPVSATTLSLPLFSSFSNCTLHRISSSTSFSHSHTLSLRHTFSSQSHVKILSLLLFFLLSSVLIVSLHLLFFFLDAFCGFKKTFSIIFYHLLTKLHPGTRASPRSCHLLSFFI